MAESQFDLLVAELREAERRRQAAARRNPPALRKAMPAPAKKPEPRYQFVPASRLFREAAANRAIQIAKAQAERDGRRANVAAVMAKAMALFDAGTITGADVRRIEARGHAVLAGL